MNQPVINKTLVIRELQRRTRPGLVVEQLQSVASLPRNMVIRRASDSGHGIAFAKETLVALIRGFVAAGDKSAADTLFMVLITSLSGAIRNKLNGWSKIAPKDRDDARQQIVLKLIGYVYELDEREELWECNFKTCFDMRIITILTTFANERLETISSVITGPDGEEYDVASEQVDPSAEEPFQQLDADEAVEFLSKIDPRLGQAVYLKYFENIQEKEIALLMNVHERTIRNWIATARHSLQREYEEAFDG